MKIKLTRHTPNENSAHVLLVIPSKELSEEETESLLGSLPADFQILVSRSEIPNAREVTEFATALFEACGAEKVKRASVLGFGAGGSVAIALCDAYPKFVRRLVLLDTRTRLEPSVVAEFVDRLEAFFPLGLPLRSLGEEFDARPVLHRLHCPTLVLGSPGLSAYDNTQTELIAGRVPNAWLKKLACASFSAEGACSEELSSLIAAFVEVAAKRPQKNKKAA